MPCDSDPATVALISVLLLCSAVQASKLFTVFITTSVVVLAERVKSVEQRPGLTELTITKARLLMVRSATWCMANSRRSFETR